MTLKEYLKEYKLTMIQFADDAKCSQGFISLVCNGKRRPSPEIAKQISDATNGEVKIMEILFPNKAA